MRQARFLGISDTIAPAIFAALGALPNAPHQAQPSPKRDLQGISSDLKWSAVDLKRIAERLSQSGHEVDAQAVLRMCAVFHAGKDRLVVYTDKVKVGQIIRSES